MTISKDTPEEYEDSDQRTNLRAPLIVLNIKAEENQKTFFGYSKNISKSGMFIATANPRDPGSRFRVEIPFPAPLSRSVQCDCEVIWARRFNPKTPYEPGMGLKFLNMPEDVATQIEAWVLKSIG